MTVFFTRYVLLAFEINYDKLYDSYRRLLEVVEERNSLGNFICSLE